MKRRDEATAGSVCGAGKEPLQPCDRRNAMHARGRHGVKRVLALFLVLALGGVFGYFLFNLSLSLAATSIYDVDECRNVYAAAALAAERGGVSVAPSLYLLPLVWLAHNVHNSVELFSYARLGAFGLFWINLLLLTLATGERLLSRKGLIALLGAGTLAPLWEFGLEVRTGNLVLTGLLLVWCVVRLSRGGLFSFATFGVMAAALVLTDFNAIAYVLPAALAYLLFPRCEDYVPRWKLMVAWLSGALGGLVGIWLLFRWFGMDGNLGACLEWGSMPGSVRYSSAQWGMLCRFLIGTPLVMTLALAGLITVVGGWWSGKVNVRGWNSLLPEAVAFLVTTIVLLANPSPFSVLNLAPFAFLLAFRYVVSLAKDIWKLPAALPVAVCLVVFAHLVPLFLAAGQNAKWPNFRQEAIIRLAESITDPASDPVCDGVGLVPTRQDIAFNWWPGQSGTSLNDMLTANPAPVIIRSYRSDWLPGDQGFIRSNYVAVSDEFWVLGTVLPPGGGTFEIVREGRYRISTLEGSDLAGTYSAGLDRTPEVPGAVEGTLDGAAFSNRPVELKPGRHTFITSSDNQPAIVWVGPNRDRLHRQGAGDRLQLFRDRYGEVWFPYRFK